MFDKYCSFNKEWLNCLNKEDEVCVLLTKEWSTSRSLKSTIYVVQVLSGFCFQCVMQAFRVFFCIKYVNLIYRALLLICFLGFWFSMKGRQLRPSLQIEEGGQEENIYTYSVPVSVNWHITIGQEKPPVSICTLKNIQD